MLQPKCLMSLFKKRQDDFANELINSGVKPSVLKILSRDFKDEDLTKVT